MKVILTITAAREYLDTDAQTSPIAPSTYVKIQKLKIPLFESHPRKYLKWKETFERYTVNLSDEVKYDYLVESTKGDAHNYVSNTSNYRDAIAKLDKQYGNKNLIMTLLIDDVRSLPPVRKGDFKGFEKLAYETNKFRNRLLEMGHEAEVENTYILKEIESKLNYDDLQKWLESTGDNVDNRKVEDIAIWLEKQTDLRNIAQLSIRRNISNIPNEYNKKFGSHSIAANAMGKSNYRCGVCRTDTHEIVECVTFLALPHNEKWESVKKNRLCFLCLNGNHQRTSCEEKRCEECNGPHHTLLHNPLKRQDGYTVNTTNLISDRLDNYRCCADGNHINIVNRPECGKQAITVNSSDQSTGMGQPRRSMLPIVKSVVINGNARVTATTLLDGGSEIHIMNSKLCNRLGLKGMPIRVSIVGVGGKILEKKVQQVEVLVEDRVGNQIMIECIVLENTCGKAVEIHPDVISLLETEIMLPKDELILKGGDIDLLIGMATPLLHQQISLKEHSTGMALMETKFGPCIVGPIPNNSYGNYVTGKYASNNVTINIQDENLQKFVEAEIAGISKDCPCQVKSDEEILFDRCMDNAWTIDESGRYEVKLPWKIDPSQLSNNREQAISRGISLEKRVSKSPVIKKLFDDQIAEMISNKILVKVDPSYVKRYLPLLAVVDLQRESSKVRVCLDSKSTHRGLCLNDAFYKGKHESSDIYEIITRFRSGNYAMIGDIRKMFWQIKINSEDQRYHGVLYKGNTYVFTRICFGNKPSPTIAELSMIKIAQIGKDTHPLASNVLIHKRYVDDIVDASDIPRKLVDTKKTGDRINWTIWV